MNLPEAKYHEMFSNRKICVLVPTYNNVGTLPGVLKGISEFTSNILVVNDGSTDGSNEILEQFPYVETIHFRENRGKGMALREGFRRAVQLGYDYAITIDSDGQHFPADLPAFIEKLDSTGPCLIIGSRNMSQSSVPGKSSFGHKFSNFWFWVETGIKAPDTQSGYRLYPVKQLEGTRFFSHKFEFEIEVIVRTAWKGIPVVSVPVSVYYPPASERVSHFRPFTDFTRISVLNTILVIITFFYINPRNFIRSIFKADTYKNLKNEIFNRNDPPALSAFSIAFGVFMGIVPIWGFQLIVAIALSVFFRLNKALVILSANISIPPMIPLIIYLSYKTGTLWVSETVPLDFSKSISLDTVHLNFMQYVYGSVTLAVIAGLLFGMISFLAVSFFRKSSVPTVND